MSLHVVVLAAGQGKRMVSNTPKVLHCLAGQPMLSRVVETAQGLMPDAIHVIIGYGGEQIKQELNHLPVHWVFQTELLGTGHAVAQILPFIPDQSDVLILSADVPLIKLDTLRALVECCRGSVEKEKYRLGLLLALVDDPSGLGRIVRNAEGQIEAIVEEKDATSLQQAIHEIYSGICCVKAKDLQRWLPNLTRNNAQNEYYLTEIIAMAVSEKRSIVSIHVQDNIEVQGVNNRLQLQQLERVWQLGVASKLMNAGVTLADAARIDVRGDLECGMDVFIDVNTLFLGHVVLGKGCMIGANCSLKDVVLGDHCEILANSVLEGCTIGDYCQVGPFARLRSGTQLASHCKIGNFVETKKAVFANYTKANHLSYLGDVTIGKEVNIGAGTITCNYDGVNKHQTVIEDGAFIGSDTQLIAPVVVGENATIGAGSTIYKNVPANELTLTERKQKTVQGWSRAKKK